MIGEPIKKLNERKSNAKSAQNVRRMANFFICLGETCFGEKAKLAHGNISVVRASESAVYDVGI